MAVAEISFDLKQLPIRAMLAHASRCARRVQPLFTLDPDHPDALALRKAVDSAIRLAEGFAAGNEIDPQLVSQIEEITVHALLAASTDSSDDKRAAYAANAAYAVVSATAAALTAEQAGDPAEAVVRVVEACMIATESAIAADEIVEPGARLDWEMLHRMRLGKFPDMGEPINPAETGMLGPLNCRKARAPHQRSQEQIAPHRVTSPAPNEHQNNGNGEARAEKFKRSIAKLRTRQSKLRLQRATLETERHAFLAELQTLETQRQSIAAEQTTLAQQLEESQTRRQALEADLNALSNLAQDSETKHAEVGLQRDELQSQCEELREKVTQLEQSQAQTLAASESNSARIDAKLQKRANDLAALKKELEARQVDVAQAAKQVEQRNTELAKLQKQLQQERELLEQQRAEHERHEGDLRNRNAQLQQQQQSLNEQQQRVAATASKISAIRKRFDSRRRRLAEERAALEVEQSRLRDLAAELTANAARIAADRQQLEAEQARIHSDVGTLADLEKLTSETQAQLQAERAQFATQREELRQSQADHQAALDALSTEKARLDAKELALAKSLEEFNAKRLAANAADQEHATGPKPEAANSQQGLGSLLHQLRDERQKLEAERREIADMRADLSSVRRQSQTPSKPSSTDPTAAEMLTFLVDPGDSSARQLSGIFSTLSQLYQSLGGPGLVFEVRACRLWSYESRPDSRSQQSSQRVFAQVRGRADDSAARNARRSDPAVWDRFVSSVMTGIGMDSALADHFDLGQDVNPDHPATAAIYDAVDFAAQAGQSADASQHPGLSIDAITQQMRRLETVRKKLEDQHHLRIELSAVGPCVEETPPQKAPAPTLLAVPKSAQSPARAATSAPSRKGWNKMKLLAIGGVIAVLVAIVVICVL